MAYIYKITNKINGKIYIGQTTGTIHDRWIGHCSDARTQRNNSAIDKAIHKYGEENFSVECLAQVPDEERFVEESKYIRKYNSMTSNGYGYNMVLEGFDLRGYEVKPARSVLQYSLEGEFIRQFSSAKECVKENPNYKIRSLNQALNRNILSYKKFLWKYADDIVPIEELVNNYKKAHASRGRIYKKRKIAKLDKDTEEILCIYDGLRAAALEIDNKRIKTIKSNISAAARLDKISHGYKWRYLEELECEESRPIIQLDKNNYNILHKYNNSVEASKTLGLSDSSGIHKAAKKGYLAYGYYWKYTEDE